MTFRRTQYTPYDTDGFYLPDTEETLALAAEAEAGYDIEKIKVAPERGCRCWDDGSAIGHPGHCCFLVDDRDLNRAIQNTDWRESDDICHVPPKVKR